ncbi:hypothetical protein Cgig2_001557 [Carnegiea gigantea]|uniref:Uncharacterized protein n=1 Tax=Carnegiea gigantea TaxID=171969 RepID=A0A9Q1QAI5_9CARY|nr:hypothetical protein Cgig2_001557 [Carnegiea gigantea]
MDGMALCVLGNFEWYCREVAFPSLPLPFDYKELCPDFVLAKAEEYAQDYEVPQLSQVAFFTMLLNDAVKLGVLRAWMIENFIRTLALLLAYIDHMVLPPKPDYVGFWGCMATALGARFPGIWFERTAPRPFFMVGDFQVAFEESLASSSIAPRRLPRPLSKLHLADMEEVARDFNIPEIIQATFYAMVVNNAAADYVRTTFIWCLKELARPTQLLTEDYRGLCPDFDFKVAEASTLDSHIPELTQAVFTPWCSTMP